MKKLLLPAMLLLPHTAEAALPPKYQNLDDLRAMVAFIEQHPKVASTLKSISIEKYTVYFGEGCRAVFGRKPIKSPRPGPAGPLLFQRSNCALDR